MAKKIYVLDTNILMGDPNAIIGFDDNTVLITGTVLQELDKHKKDLGEDGYNTRHAIKAIDMFTDQEGDESPIGMEYALPTGGKLAMFVDGHRNMLPESFSLSVADARYRLRRNEGQDPERDPGRQRDCKETESHPGDR